MFTGMIMAQEHSDRCKAHTITERHLVQQGLPASIMDALPRIENAGDRGQVLTVPVVVHVVWNTSAENVPSSAIHDMIAEMNADYSQTNSDISGVRPAFTASIGNAQIEFCLAETDPNGAATTGITRTQTTETWFDPDTETDDMKSAPLGKAPWNPSQYLNIWICDISSGATGGFVTLGYAYLPVGGVVGTGIDGLVIDYQYGLQAGSRTATHEIGHYLGLNHTWGDQETCASDDGFTDTPSSDSPTFSCSNTSLMKCGTLTQYENFMDYSNCPVMFTAQQSMYMRGILQGVRSGLLSNNACGNSTPTVCIPTSAAGTSEGDFINSVSLGSINNTNSGGTTAPTYTDYSGTMGTSLAQGATYTIQIQSGEYPEDNYAAWIDYDQDLTFEANEKLGEFATTMAMENGSITFTVPAGAMLGDTRMRVRGVYHNTGEPSPTDPCYGYDYGETEDYGITITSGGGGGGYCIPTSEFGPSDGDFINAVNLGDINNQNSGSATGSTYNDYTAMSTTLIRGMDYSITVETGEYAEDNFAAWIDMNGDETFSPNEKLGEFASTTPFQTGTIDFTLPLTADLGPTRLRIRGVYHLDTEPTPSEPCFDYAYGETEDYTVLIEQATMIGSEIATEFDLYPNPATGTVNIVLKDATEATITLIDAQGRIVLAETGNGAFRKLDLGGISAGHYVLIVQQRGTIGRRSLQVLGDR